MHYVLIKKKIVTLCVQEVGNPFTLFAEFGIMTWKRFRQARLVLVPDRMVPDRIVPDRSKQGSTDIIK